MIFVTENYKIIGNKKKKDNGIKEKETQLTRLTRLPRKWVGKSRS